MNGITTFLSERVESLLPHTPAAACIRASPWCSTTREKDGDCYAYFHKDCHVSCYGKPVCTGLYPASCSGLVESCT
ncbi:MAG TPA: hypothetical protein VMR14_21380 [Streptosporangiaceae bacterium]|nr:hypothetical protein [Streptosporangiaceae bacterium]